MLQVCLNGARTRAGHAHLPVTPDELASAAREAVAAGAEDVHLHPKDHERRDTLDAAAVAAALTAVRAAVPGIPVGVTTGAWAAPDPAVRAARVRSWTVLPDHASVNWHEDGAADVAGALLERGVGIEAGIFSGTSAAGRFAAWPHSGRVLRVLAEITDTDPRTALLAAAGLLAALGADPAGRTGRGGPGPAPVAAAPILLHGEDSAAWPVLRLAVSRGLDTRIGLEDVLLLPDGSPAASNADLVREALGIVHRTSPG